MRPTLAPHEKKNSLALALWKRNELLASKERNEYVGFTKCHVAFFVH